MADQIRAANEREQKGKQREQKAADQRRRARERAEIYALNAALERAENTAQGALVLLVGGSNFNQQVPYNCAPLHSTRRTRPQL